MHHRHKAAVHSGKSAISILKRDHDAVKKLFSRFERASGVEEKKAIVDEALNELKLHTAVEEQVFYPALRNAIEDKEGLLDEADEEHHVAKVLISELELMTGEESNFDAKFTVLAESVKHHIKEEEDSMFLKASRSGLDLEALGQQLSQIKEALIREGVPPDAESKMVKAAGVRGESPSKLAAAQGKTHAGIGS